MPTIEISKADMEQLLGKKLDLAMLSDYLSYAKAEIKSVDGDVLKVDIKDVNRPELWCVEGLAREINSKVFGKLKQYKLQPSQFLLKVDKKVLSVRPCITCFIAKNVNINDALLRQLIQLQEKLCENFGRKREQASLGIYDFDKIVWPITYTTKPPEFKFVPLDFDKELSLKQILSRHEKGKQYGHLLEGFLEYPILIDNANNVLSMPPIINSAYTGKVTEQTKNLFVEVTGFSERFVLPVALSVALALADRNAKLYTVKIKYPNKTTMLKFEKQTIKVSKKKLEAFRFNFKQIKQLANKCGFDVKTQKNCFVFSYPNYRQDIMNARDIIEDLLIAYGYNNIIPTMPDFELIDLSIDESTEAKLDKLKAKIRELLVGLQFQEVATFILTDKQKLTKAVRLKEKPIAVANPVSLNYACLRNNLYPCLLSVLEKSKNAEYPQNIFEIGYVVNPKENQQRQNQIEKNSKQKVEEQLRLCVVLSHANITFTNAKQVLQYLMRELNLNFKLERIDHDSFIEGRTGSIIVSAGSNTSPAKKVGFIGEVHPAVLNNFKLNVPVSLFELNLSELVKLTSL